MNAHTSLIKSPAILYDALSLLSNPYGNERANSVAAIKESVSAIEAFMNELGELGYGYEHCGQPEQHAIVRLGRCLRESERNRDSIKKKVQLACEALSGKKFLKGSLSYQKFSLVVDVRNELTHPKASVIDQLEGTLTPPKPEQCLIKRHKSYGFTCIQGQAHDWTNAISNKKFSEWAHLSIVETMIYVLKFFPYPEAIDSYMQIYGLDRYIKMIPHPPNTTTRVRRNAAAVPPNDGGSSDGIRPTRV
jgi:hypothetical protein